MAWKEKNIYRQIYFDHPEPTQAFLHILAQCATSMWNQSEWTLLRDINWGLKHK